jgi:hypothetical protein
MQTLALRVFVMTLLACPPVSHAEEPPPLKDTNLFSTIAKGCRTLDLTTWRHPTRTLLLEQGAEIEQVQLCNDDKYPIFFVRFPYDPQGATADYFHPLFEKMRGANGGWPFSFVALTDHTVLNLRYSKGQVAVDYEPYAP